MTPSDRPAPRPLRRDAQRNRDAIIAAARQLFCDHGLEAPLEQIARQAGVGIATLYRHFPNRAALLDARDQPQYEATVEGDAAQFEVTANDLVTLRTNGGTFSGNTNGREVFTAISQEMFRAVKNDTLDEFILNHPEVLASKA